MLWVPRATMGSRAFRPPTITGVITLGTGQESTPMFARAPPVRIGLGERLPSAGLPLLRSRTATEFVNPCRTSRTPPSNSVPTYDPIAWIRSTGSADLRCPRCLHSSSVAERWASATGRSRVPGDTANASRSRAPQADTFSHLPQPPTGRLRSRGGQPDSVRSMSPTSASNSCWSATARRWAARL
jgi:hypothetical protein